MPGLVHQAVLSAFRDDLGREGIGHHLDFKALTGAAIQHPDGGELLGPLLGVLALGSAEAHGAATCELDHLGQRAVPVMSCPHGGGVSVHGVLHEGAAGALGDGGRRDIAQGREEARTHAAKALLEPVTEIQADAVHFYLGVSVVQDADGLLMLPGLLQLAEQRVEETEIVFRQVNAVRVLVEERAIVVQGVIFHPEAGVHSAEHRVHVYLGQLGIGQRPPVRGIADGERAGGYAIGRKDQPQHTQRGKNAQEEYENLLCTHNLQR